MATLKVNGVRDRSLGQSDLGSGLPKGRIVVKDAARVQTARADTPPISFEGLLPDDVVEIETQDGLRIWIRVEDAARDFAPRSQRGAVTDAIEIPSELAIGPASRSIGGWAIKALKIVGIDIAEKITDFVSDHVEGQLQPGPGLYRASEDDPARLVPVDSLDSKGRVLLFLHGTASSTSGSFSGLWTVQEGNLIAPLFKHYGGQVLAYQHRTLTESPIENALAVAKQLRQLVAAGTEIHLVSHSRGGLIGELLARGLRSGAAPFTPAEIALFDGDTRARDRAALEELSEVLESAQFKVTKFVRVACPARGTTLADRRLDRYFSTLVNLLSLIPALKASVVYDGLTNLLAGVLKKRTDPEELPGIEAMMPTSPLVRMLNNPDVRTQADLHVLGGDLAGTGIVGRLKTLATDFYYRDDHDIVVNTPAMLGGTERAQPIKYWIDTGNQVTHFHYFQRADTARRLVAALTGSSSDFRTLTVRPSAVTSADYVKRAAISRPVVIVLPGVMGSELTVDDRPVWMKLAALAGGGLKSLAGGKVHATGLLADGYGDLCEHLKATHEVVPFPYDWRQPLTQAADGLRAEIERVLPLAEAANQPVRLLAHSMGGLVVRTMLADPNGQDVWTRMCKHQGARFIMLGTPNGGSFAIPAMLLGRDALVKKLALVDLHNSHATLLETIASFEGVLNLLPYSSALDFFDRKEWARLLDLDAPEARGLFGSSVASSKSAGFRWALPAQGDLDTAKTIAGKVTTSPLDARRTVYVAGVADETACDLVVDQTAADGRKVKVIASALGDGRVLWETGIPKNIPAYYMDTVHGDLANDARHFGAIVDLLNSGTTARLPTTPPARRSTTDRFEMRDPLPDMVPDESELVSAALGGRRRKVETPQAETRIAIRMVHDNLTNARSPVLVSHYHHDVIVAAEAYLDRCLDNRLSELLRMELYPGPINTGVVVLNDPQAVGDLSIHPGAIVTGLGDVGELTPGSLASALSYALTLYGADCVGRARRRQQRAGLVTGSTISAPVTAILIGSGEGGLSLADSVRALLRAVLDANQRLLAGGQKPDGDSESLVAQIDCVDIFELWEDRAVEGLHALRLLAQAPEFSAYIVEQYLKRGDEGRRRARFEQAAGWWQRIRISGDDDGTLAFEAITQTARAPAQLLSPQRDTVDSFIKDAIGTTANDPRLDRTLFEMLVPNDFKPYAPDRRKLALMLKGTAAAIPWELMRDGFGHSPEPVSVASGMIRQLLVEQERSQVLRAPAKTALVIGNPIVKDPRFPSLAGARQEAETVDELLRADGYDVVRLLEGDAPPKAVYAALHDRPWRILHLAAHGVFEFKNAKGKIVSGLVLNDDAFFTADDADQMRYVPELVFINCCHLGAMRAEVPYHKLAANLASQFIRMGARAVVCAGWAVDDGAAKTFATSLYKCMLAGMLYGDAVFQARRDTFGGHAGTNTWGAYQCYGDPSFSFLTRSQKPGEEVFVSETELAVWLDGLSVGARQATDNGDLLRQLEERIARTPAEWWTSAELCAKAAAAFTELSQFEPAVEYYEKSLVADPALGPLKAVEQLASCRIRWAGTLLRSQTPDIDKVEKLLDAAKNVLDHLLAIGETPERWSLRGSLSKRRALLPGATAAATRTALVEMSNGYRSAYELSQKRGGPDSYPLGNLLAADIVLSWEDKKRDPAVKKALGELEELARALAGTHTDSFNLSAEADRLLLRALHQRKVSNQARAQIAEVFANALSRGASAKVKDSMRTQFQFFKRMMKTQFPKKDGRDEMIAQIVELEEELLGK